MKHYINGPPATEEFHREFRRIREQFVEKLDHHIAGRAVLAFRACDTQGQPVAWVWDDETCKFSHHVGAIGDAKRFMRDMFDQGMYFAFAGVCNDAGWDVWLTAWEDPPNRGPVWPSGIMPVFQEVHEGVVIRGQSN